LGAIRLALIVCPPTRNNICIEAFLVTSVYSMFQQLFTSWEVKLTHAYVVYMLFSVSCNHSLKKSQIETVINYVIMTSQCERCTSEIYTIKKTEK